MSYTGHKNTKMPDGKTLAKWMTPTIEQEAVLYDVPMPSEKQIALVISAMRMHAIIMHAVGYNYSKLGQPDEKETIWPVESSIGRYFRDAARVTLDELEATQDPKRAEGEEETPNA